MPGQPCPTTLSPVAMPSSFFHPFQKVGKEVHGRHLRAALAGKQKGRRTAAATDIGHAGQVGEVAQEGPGAQGFFAAAGPLAVGEGEILADEREVELVDVLHLFVC